MKLGLVLIPLVLVPFFRQPQPSAQLTPKKIALLVGISDYKRGGGPVLGFNDLATLPDLVNMDRILKETFSFDSVKTIRNDEATQQGIIARFEADLIGAAEPGDSVLFYYTGHGHQVRNQTEDTQDQEPDGLDEALVTWLDESESGLPVEQQKESIYLRDDVLDKLLSRLESKMSVGGKIEGSITVILDSCHSGTGTKGPLIAKGRSWDPKLDGEVPFGLTGKGVEGGDWGAPGGRAGVVFISGCESRQSSYMRRSPAQGSVLTYLLTQSLGAAKSGLTYRDLHELIAPAVLGERPEQNPQIEGELDSLVFGDGKRRPGEPYLVVQEKLRKSDKLPMRVRFNVGTIAGVAVGSIYTLHSKGGDVAKPESVIGEIRIIEADLFNSIAEVTSLKDEKLEGELVSSRAALKSFAIVSNPLRVYLPPGHRLTKTLSNLPFVTTSGVKPDDFDLACDVNKSVTGWSRLSRDRMPWPAGVSGKELEDRLMAAWRWKELCNLKGGPGSPEVSLEIITVKESDQISSLQVLSEEMMNGKKTTKGGSNLIERGDRAWLVCRNKSKKALYMNLILLGHNGKIEVFPEPGEPSEIVAPGGRPVALMEVEYTELDAGFKEQSDLIKLLATRERVDLGGLHTKQGRPKPKGPNAILQTLLFGFQDGLPKDTMTSNPEMWGIADLVLVSRS